MFDRALEGMWNVNPLPKAEDKRMAFNSEMRKEKPKDDKAKPAESKEKKEKKLDQDLKNTFPASDPIAKENIVTGSRAKKPVLPD
jgi:hypothetical protein